MGVRISLSKLAAAVSNCGGVGTISTALIGGAMSHNSMDEHENADVRELTDQIRKAKKLTKGVLSVNVMVALSNYPALVTTSAKEGIDIIVSGAGLPLSLPKLTEGTKAKIGPIVSSGRAVDVICRNWIRKYNHAPDLVVVEGPLAGGHLGFSFDQLADPAKTPQLEDIVVEVIQAVKKYEISGKKIPVIAAGGIYDGKDIARMIKLGAAGVQVATRFAATVECDAAEVFKQAYVNCKKEDIVIIKSPVHMPGRAINNEFLRKAEKGEIKFRCEFQCLKPCIPKESPYCIADALINAAKGNLDNGFVFTGSNAGRIDRIMTVRELMDELVKDAEANL